MININGIILTAAISIFICLIPARAQKFSFVETGEGILLKYNNQHIFFYQTATKSHDGLYPRANYIHPLYGLNGEILTEDFPEDHLHHRGIFWAWHQLYVKGQRVGDPWECKGITWRINHTEYKASQDTAVLITRLTWEENLPGKANANPGGLIGEETVITCIKNKEDQLEINFDIRLTALHDGTRIGGSEDVKGYSGFSIRTKLPDDLTFYSSSGKVIPRETAIDAGGWINMQATFEPGREQQTSITLMCDPNDPMPFHGWILRDKGSMQNAAFPGRDPVSIPEGKTLSMQYKILLHRPDMSREQIGQIYNQFIRKKD